MMAGACGHTYGNHNIWQMWQPGRNPISVSRTPWQESIDYPGAFQAGYMKSFFENLDWQKLVPNSEIVKSGPNTNGMEILASTASDGSFLVAYSPYGANFSLDLSDMAEGNLGAQWFNPRLNNYILLGRIEKGENVVFDPPSDAKRGNDWVLLISVE